jgi:hypothetical protein
LPIKGVTEMRYEPSIDLIVTIDLLSRITESIEIYLEDDRSGIKEVLKKEIKEANRLTKKFYKLVRESQS